MSKPKSVSEEGPKPQVKPETWIKWSKSVFKALKTHGSLKSLYEATDAEKIPRKRVQSILAILEGLGVTEVRDDQIVLLGAGESLEALSLGKEAMELRLKLEEANTEMQALRERVAGLEAELRKLRSGVSEVDCTFLRPLDMVGASGQHLYYCLKRGITMGEKAELCLVCVLKVPR